MTCGLSQVLLVTSRMGSIEDNGSGEYYGYRVSGGERGAGRSMCLCVVFVGLVCNGWSVFIDY